MLQKCDGELLYKLMIYMLKYRLFGLKHIERTVLAQPSFYVQCLDPCSHA